MFRCLQFSILTIGNVNIFYHRQFIGYKVTSQKWLLFTFSWFMTVTTFSYTRWIIVHLWKKKFVWAFCPFLFTPFKLGINYFLLNLWNNCGLDINSITSMWFAKSLLNLWDFISLCYLLLSQYRNIWVWWNLTIYFAFVA